MRSTGVLRLLLCLLPPCSPRKCRWRAVAGGKGALQTSQGEHLHLIRHTWPHKPVAWHVVSLERPQPAHLVDGAHHSAARVHGGAHSILRQATAGWKRHSQVQQRSLLQCTAKQGETSGAGRQRQRRSHSAPRTMTMPAARASNPEVGSSTAKRVARVRAGRVSSRVERRTRGKHVSSCACGDKAQQATNHICPIG